MNLLLFLSRRGKSRGLLRLLVLCVVSAASAVPFASFADTAPAASLADPCGPSAGGATDCDGSGPASPGNSTGVQIGAGNPINLLSGNKYQRETDLAALPGKLGLEIVRHYNSSQRGLGLMGRSWRLSYETRLYVRGSTLQIATADGRLLIFQRDPKTPGQCASTSPGDGELRIRRGADGLESYDWHWPNGRELNFDHRGLLLTIGEADGQMLMLSYGVRGELVQVIDPQGRRLNLIYASPKTPGFKGIVAIDSPAGRFEYAHEGSGPGISNLRTARAPDGSTRRYHYEDRAHPHALTGISQEVAAEAGQIASQRLNTWAYDARGRAVLSVKGEAKRLDGTGKPIPGTGSLTPGTGQEQINLAYPTISLPDGTPGETVLTNSLGQQSRYRHAQIAGQHRLLEARGSGCASCGEMDVRYDYDRRGSLIGKIKLDSHGQPLWQVRWQHDDRGRIIRTTRQTWHQGKPGAARLIERREYHAATSHPTLIARPSVVSGHEHQIRIEYNERGQPLQITETGYSPLAADGRLASGAEQATPIERTTTYTYQDIRGRSRLLQIDGPLPNGPGGTPEDSDITRHEWDEWGRFIVGIEAPGGITSTFTYDLESSRPSEITLSWLDQVRRIRYEYEANGNILARTQEVLAADGQPIPGKRTVTHQRNALGQLVGLTWFDGHHIVPGQEAKGAVPGIDHSAPLAGGLADTMPSPDALLAFYGEAGTATAAEVLRYEANGTSAERRFDDFGRVVALRLPGQEWQTAQFDAADRLIGTADAVGNRQEVGYNLAGQMIRLRRFSSTKQQWEETVSIHWRGPLRIEETIVDANDRVRHRTRYEYSPWGELIRQTAEIHAPDRLAPVLLTQSLRYDAGGRLVSRTLPSGQRIAYRYAAVGPQAGGLAQMEQINWHPWLDFLMTRLPERWQPKTVLFRADLVASGKSPGTEVEHGQFPAQPEPGLGSPLPDADLNANGLPSQLITSRGELHLTWNTAHQLVEIDDTAGQAMARYTYDARGRRASKSTPEGQEYYLYDGTQLIAVMRQPQTGNGHLQEYLYHGYRPIAWLAGDTAYRLQSDHRGAVTAVLAADSEAPLWHSDIDAWGAVPAHAAQSGLDPRLRLINQYADTETGLSYNIGRYYDPQRGRFISPDPAGIADSIDSATPPSLQLDMTAYAAGQPSLYFDPDGAARLVFYAITTGANGRALGTAQGFTKARWAFSIEDIQADGTGGSDAINQLMQTYARNGTGLLYDANGNFLASGTRSASWDGSANSRIDPFRAHYGANLITVTQFTFDNFSNRDAALIIAALTGNTESLGQCPNASGLLPEIWFGAEDAPINVTQETAHGANRQRILNCGRNAGSTVPMDYANDTERNRVEKYVAAAELTEVSRIGRDCSQDGCPGVDIDGQAGHVYHASYGRTQFIGSTFLDTILGMSASRNPLTLSDDQIAIGVTQDMLQRIQDGLNRANEVQRDPSRRNQPETAGAFTKYRNRYTCATAENAWDNAGQPAQPPAPAPLTQAELNNFQTQTGLGRQAFIDMICFVPTGNARPIGEGRAAFGTEAIFTDTVLRDWMMELFRDNDRFDLLSRLLIRSNLNTILNRPAITANFQNGEAVTLTDGTANPAYAARQREIEQELAMRVARLHNGGRATATSTDLGVLTRACTAATGRLCDVGGYVNKFIGNTTGHGEWRSLRCVENPTTGTGAASNVRGVQMTPLQL